MTVVEYLDKTKELYTSGSDGHVYRRRLRPRLLCKDGWNISAQESPMHNSLTVNGEYKSVELGFLYDDSSNKADLNTLLPFAEAKDDPENYIWNYVPISVLQLICDRHGGIVGGCEYSYESELYEIDIEMERMNKP